MGKQNNSSNYHLPKSNTLIQRAKEVLKPSPTMENLIWLLLIFAPIGLKEEAFNSIIEQLPFKYFEPIPLLLLIIFVLTSLIAFNSDLIIRQVFKWMFPIFVWCLCYFHDYNNVITYIIILLFFYCFVIFFILIGQYINEIEINKANHGLISDDPIEENGEHDSFGRKEYAESIVKEISKTTNKRAFNIAITGAWGSGKTSFLNLIKGDMQNFEKHKNKFITVKYNPWDFKEDKIIGLDLLKTISHELAHEKELQENIKGLMISLQGIDQSPWYKVIPYFLSGLSKEKSINEYRKEIGHILGLKSQKLVIFLDDLDRLNGDEILEVFKTIRNSFDIANTFFILGFDFEYVIDQIKEKVIGERALEYLDKIFQMRLFMPTISDFHFYKEFKKLVKENLDIHLKADIDWSFQINNKRNTLHLINSLKVFFNKEESKDYNFGALVQIECLKIIDPLFYNYIIENTESILNSYNSVGSTSVFISGGDSIRNTYESVMATISEKSKTKSIDLLETFFLKLDQESKHNIKSEIFFKYFKYGIQKAEFSDALLSKIIETKNKELLYINLTENNKYSLYTKIDKELNSNKLNSWLLELFIELIYKDRKYLWLYNNKYKIDDFMFYTSLDDLKTKIENLELRDKIVFVSNLENKTDDVYLYIVEIYNEYFQEKIDDLFWVVYHSLNEDKSKLEESLKTRFFEVTKNAISEDFLNIFQSAAVSFSPEGESRTAVNHQDPSLYYFVGLFSAKNWLELLPKEKEIEPAYQQIKLWLESLTENSSAELNYTEVFGVNYFDRHRRTFNESTTLGEEE